MDFLQKIQAVWQNVSIVQKALLAAIALTVVFVGVMFTMWAKRPHMTVLYSSLDIDEAAKITEKIAEKGIPYKLSPSGTTVYAPKKHVSQLHLDMANEGLPQGGLKGYSISPPPPKKGVLSNTFCAYLNNDFIVHLNFHDSGNRSSY